MLQVIKNEIGILEAKCSTSIAVSIGNMAFNWHADTII